MHKKKVADIIVESLQLAGVKHCYGVVGDTLNHVSDAIRRSNMTWVHMRHEESGAFAAGSEALLTGRLTVCAGSCGPGSLHFINGIFEANRNRALVLAAKVRRPDCWPCVSVCRPPWPTPRAPKTSLNTTTRSTWA